MLEVIKNRHSIRKYTAEKVTKEDLIPLLRSAMQAPTAKNGQDWRFIAILNKEDLLAISGFPGYYAMFKEAAAAIIVMADTDKYPDDHYNYVNAGAACENILLEAVNQGLGAVWCAIGPNAERIKAFKNHFALADNVLPIAAIALGYPNEDKAFCDRFDETKISWR